MEFKYIFFALWLATLIIIIRVFQTKGKKALEIFPTIDFNKVLFREKSVFGRSRKSLMTKLGGAKNLLDVIITEDELWIKSPMFFAGFLKKFDLIHRVKLSRINRVELVKNVVIVSFSSDEQSENVIELRLIKHKEFIDAIRK